MGHEFDADYWERHWRGGHDDAAGSMLRNPPHPWLLRELGGVRPGTALEAGCGAGAEAIWLAAEGWTVTGADLSSEALAHAAARATAAGVAGRVTWVAADLSSWKPATSFDLVTTHYAHASIPQLDLYERLAGWVSPGGTLLVVGHRHEADGTGHGHGSEVPAEAAVTAAAVTQRLDPGRWDVVTAEEPDRTLAPPDGRRVTLRDVVVRATRRR